MEKNFLKKKLFNIKLYMLCKFENSQGKSSYSTVMWEVKGKK